MPPPSGLSGNSCCIVANASGVKSTGGKALSTCFMHPPRCPLSAAPCAALVMLAPADSARCRFSKGVQHLVAWHSSRSFFASPCWNRLIRVWITDAMDSSLSQSFGRGVRIMTGSRKDMARKGVDVSRHMSCCESSLTMGTVAASVITF